MLEALSRFTQILDEVTLDLVGDGVPVERRTVKWNVRSPLKSRHIEGRYRCPLSANSGHHFCQRAGRKPLAAHDVLRRAVDIGPDDAIRILSSCLLC
jgi:hypothetical protein